LTAFSNPASTTSQSVHPHNIQVGAVIGGVVGGIVTIFIALFLLHQWRRRRTSVVDFDLEPKYAPAYSQLNAKQALPPNLDTSAISTSPVQRTLSFNSGLHSTTTQSIPSVVVSSVTTNAGRSDQPSTLTAASHRANPLRTLSGGMIPRESGGASLTPAPVASEDVASTSSNTTAMNNIPTDSQLTSEQLDFVHTLYTANVPPAEIIAVMDRMRAARGQSLGGALVDNPPVYDFKDN
jgi:hypothetical protein